MTQPALDLAAVSKSFDGFPALAGASFSVAAGEVHALLGENGAGKSSLMNVAAGLYRPDSGVIRVDGREVAIDGPVAAKRLGIGMVHQHYKLVKAFSAVENILLACGKGRFAGAAAVEQAIRRQAEAIGFQVDLRRPVGALSVAEQQRVEILKVLVEGARILILDEPSAVLTDKEAEALLGMMRQLAAQGAAVVLVTHKLGEVKRFADRVTVMRGGRTIATADPKARTVAELTSMIVGELVAEKRHPARDVGEPILTLEGVAGCRADGHRVLADASFALRRGEIYGIAGVGGNGQTELAEILMGVRKPVQGRIAIDGTGDVTHDGASRRRDLGLASIPADRQTYGLAGELSVADNYAVQAVRSGGLGGWMRVDGRAAQAQAATAVSAFEVQGVRGLRQKASLLSGGNAQKLVIAREFASQPRIVVAHSPSRGLDMRAAGAVHRRLREARDAGAGVLLISEDLDEVMLLSDRIGVMSGGRIVREFDTPADRQAIGTAMVHHG
ncbi:ABC transporter ATP-binding protein [Kumtagia ephedrae]|uniref:ABC transporter ATP-binding protein n=1 Tax=Kumtagia ephedrae TaxID=2116701 RepID=A0A2P7S2P5_9HYPH|nr:ABC transporter ATP-binding protein [Mesorhizobium ephedrae]PSJ56723.1 ABC transporter ATP-binding protein [Mesorhizobium ephedrae]